MLHPWQRMHKRHQGYEAHLIAAIFSSADEIVFEHGATGVRLIFAKPGVTIIELLPERNHITSKKLLIFSTGSASRYNKIFTLFLEKLRNFNQNFNLASI